MDKYKRKSYKSSRLEFNVNKNKTLDSMRKFLKLLDDLEMEFLDLYKLKYLECLRILSEKLEDDVTLKSNELYKMFDQCIDVDNAYYDLNDLVLKFRELADVLERFDCKKAALIRPDFIENYLNLEEVSKDLVIDHDDSLSRMIHEAVDEVLTRCEYYERVFISNLWSFYRTWTKMNLFKLF